MNPIPKLRSLFSSTSGNMMSMITISLIAIFTITAYLLSVYYTSEVNARLYFTLKKEHEGLVRFLDKKINYIFKNIDLTQSTINVDDQSIRVCDNSNCIKYSIFLLRSDIIQQLPEYLEINLYFADRVIFSNNKHQNTSRFNTSIYNNQINVSTELFVNQEYIEEIQQEVWRIYQILLIASFFFSLCIYIIYALSKRLIVIYYREKYYKLIHSIKLSQRQKEWEKRCSQRKELKMNWLFAEEAKSITHNQSFNLEEIIQNHKTLPYSKILYTTANNGLVDIDLQKLMDDMQDIFNNNGNLKLEIIYDALTKVKFRSVYSFYQILYSIIKYMSFLIQKEVKVTEQQINININESISISFPHGLVSSKKELLNKSHDFFRTHCNPFILDIRIVVSILEAAGFWCTLSNDQIWIKFKKINHKEERTNVIEFPANQDKNL